MSYRRFLPSIIAGVIALMLFIGGVLGDLVANDLTAWLGGAYYRLVWGFVSISALVAAAWAGWTVWQSRDSEPVKFELPVLPDAQGFWLNRPSIDEESFFGRDPDLHAISAAFEDHRVVVIYGGVGYCKTRLAAQYTEYSRSRGFWTTAGDNLTGTLAQLVPHLGVKIADLKDEEIIWAVKARMHQMPPGNLWVLDNLGNLDQVNALLADLASIRLLVTTRDSRYWILPTSVQPLKLGMLDAPSAVALLCSRSRVEPQDWNLNAIAEEVGFLP